MRGHTLNVLGETLACSELLPRSLWTGDHNPDGDLGGLGKVLVTGAAGSIGRALVSRLTAAHIPTVAADLDSARLHDLAATFPDVTVRLVDLADSRQTTRLVTEARPTTIVHLAACKHVVYCEANPTLAWHANTLTTLHLLRAAERLGEATRFVSASTDKVATPGSVLSRTKQAAEQAIGAFDGDAMRALAVRLPNVLGSSGNVLEVWTRQAREGRSLSVWSDDMTRHFACMHEAVDLLLAAALTPDPPSWSLAPAFTVPVQVLDLAMRVAIWQAAKSRRRPDVEVRGWFDAAHARHEQLWRPEDAPLNAAGDDETLRWLNPPAPARHELMTLLFQHAQDLKVAGLPFDLAEVLL